MGEGKALIMPQPIEVSEQYRMVSFRGYTSAHELLEAIALWWEEIEDRDSRFYINHISMVSIKPALMHGADVICLFRDE